MDALVTDSVTLANRLRPVLLKLNRHLRRELHSLDVTAGQVAVLAAIRNAPGIGIRELADREGMSSPGMSKYVARLEAAGLVTRAPVGDDRRRVGLLLTEDAQRVLRSVRSRRTAWLASRLKRLTDAEVEAVDAAIEPLMRLLEDGE
jgi:DNA-binding MarR family transcriptional regulator